MKNTAPFRIIEATRPCVLCEIEVDVREETVHLTKYHAPGAIKLGDIIWLSPHEAIWRGRRYKPEKPS